MEKRNEQTIQKKTKEKKPYYQMNAFQKGWFQIKNGVKEKISNFHFSFIKFIIAILFIALLIVIVVVIVSNRSKFPVKAAYDKTGFIPYDALENKSVHFENETYVFDMDYQTTHFTLTDKRTNQEYSSLPKDTNKKSFDTLTLWYASGISEVREFGNYAYSILYHNIKNYAIRETNQSVEVLYSLGGKIKIDYTDFPKVIEKNRYEEKILNAFTEYANNQTGEEKSKARTALRILKACYKLSETEYTLDGYEALSDEYIDNLYYIFYTICGYTKEDLENDNLQYGNTQNRTYPKFEVAIRYTLTNDGLMVELVNESIVDYEDAPLVYIDVLPYFGCGTTSDQGYALIPDGSGVLMDFNAKRSYTSTYEARIYGTDYSITTDTAPANVEKLNLGVYGMKINSGGFINIATNGAESCSIRYHNSDKANPYNTTNYRFFYRECDYYWFSSLSQPVNITTWSNEFNKQSLNFWIKTLEENSTYVTMAKTYQAYLVNQGLLKKHDETKEVGLDLTLLGGYLEEKNFIGIPYKKVTSLTNTDEVKQIVDALLEKEVKNINVIYEGFYNEGIKTTYAGKIDYHGVIGSKSKLKKLNAYLEENNLHFYPNVRISSAYSKDNLSDKMLVKNIYGEIVARYDADEPKYLLDTTSTPLYTLQINTYDKTLQKVCKQLNKLDIQNIGFLDFGNEIYGNYQTKNTYFRSDCLEAYLHTMQTYAPNFQNILMNNPNDYAFQYASLALNVPFKGTDYQIVYQVVPFYQLVVSGYIDYSFEPFNLNDEYSFDYYKMKALEYGSNISMVWTYEKTMDLIGTEYDHYYSTYYQNWLDETVAIYEELNQTKAYQGVLQNHLILDEKGQITTSIYDNGLQIIFNYTNQPFIYEEMQIDANSYKIVKEASNG